MHGVAWLLTDLFFGDDIWIGFFVEAPAVPAGRGRGRVLRLQGGAGGRSAGARAGDRGGEADPRHPRGRRQPGGARDPRLHPCHRSSAGERGELVNYPEPRRSGEVQAGGTRPPPRTSSRDPRRHRGPARGVGPVGRGPSHPRHRAHRLAPPAARAPPRADHRRRRHRLPGRRHRSRCAAAARRRRPVRWPSCPAALVASRGMANDSSASATPPEVRVLLPARTVARAVLAAAGVVVGLYLLYQVRSVIGLLFAALFFALAIAPPVNWLDAKGLPALAGDPARLPGDRRRDLRHRPAARPAPGRRHQRALRRPPRLCRRPARERELPRVRRRVQHHREDRGAGRASCPPSWATRPAPCATSRSASSHASCSSSRSW